MAPDVGAAVASEIVCVEQIGSYFSRVGLHASIMLFCEGFRNLQNRSLLSKLVFIHAHWSCIQEASCRCLFVQFITKNSGVVLNLLKSKVISAIFSRRMPSSLEDI